MWSFVIALILSLIFSIFYILLTVRYKAYLDKIYFKKEIEKKERHLEKYASKEKKDVMKLKLDKISQIISETEKHIKEVVDEKVRVAEAQVKAQEKEEEIIEKAGIEYKFFTLDYRSAIPKSEEELVQDLTNLKEAFDKLESIEKETYGIDATKTNVGVGIFYEKISRRFNEIIDENNLSDFKIVPLQRLKHYAFLNIKNLKDDDFLPILNLMKETQLLNDLIEINPTFYVLIFKAENLQFSNPEKVVLSFAYDEDYLTIQKLIEITKWDYTYTTKILNQLEKKGAISVYDENISVDGFGHEDERKIWNATVNEQIQKEKDRELEKAKRKAEIKAKIKEKLEDVGRKKLEKPEIELKKPKEIFVEELDSDNLEDTETPIIQFDKKPVVKKLPPIKKPQTAEEEELLELDLELEDLDKEEIDLKERISQTILSFHENFSVLNGGFAQEEIIKDFVEQELEDVQEDILISTFEQLKELKLIYSSIMIGNSTFYLFKKMQFTANEKKFINFALNKKPLNKKDYIKELKWDEGKVLRTMKKLQDKGILRIKADKIIIPGIIQKKK